MGAKKTREHHGMSRSRTYRTWLDMRSRCFSPKNPWYSSYGGRGISIDPKWDAFSAFYDDMGERPSGATIERLDVNGNYEPDNCVWATQQEQSINKRTPRDNTSGVTGVSLVKLTGRWKAYISYKRVFYVIGTFEDWFDAVCARKSAENKYWPKRELVK